MGWLCGWQGQRQADWHLPTTHPPTPRMRTVNWLLSMFATVRMISPFQKSGSGPLCRLWPMLLRSGTGGDRGVAEQR